MAGCTRVDDEERRLLQRLETRVENLTQAMQKASLAEYVELVRNPRWMIYTNLIAGLARGLGTAVGFFLLGALVVYILQSSFVSHLPVIGRLIADLVRIVQYELKTR